MNDQFKEYLKENLSIEVEQHFEQYGETYLTVNLILDGEVISSDSTSVTGGDIMSKDGWEGF